MQPKSRRFPSSPKDMIEDSLDGHQVFVKLSNESEDEKDTVMNKHARSNTSITPKFLNDVTNKNFPATKAESEDLKNTETGIPLMAPSSIEFLTNANLVKEVSAPQAPKKIEKNESLRKQRRSFPADSKYYPSLLNTGTSGVPEINSLIIKKRNRTDSNFSRPSGKGSLIQIARSFSRGNTYNAPPPASSRVCELIQDKAAPIEQTQEEAGGTLKKKKKRESVPKMKLILQKHANYEADKTSKTFFRLLDEIRKVRKNRLMKVKYQFRKVKNLVKIRDFDLRKRLERLRHAAQPDTTLRFAWDVFITFLIIHDLITLPIMLAFSITFGGGIFVYLKIGCFLIDILLNFNTAFYFEGELVRDRKSITSHYLRSWFWIDFIATFPLEFIISGLEDKDSDDGPNGRIIKALAYVKLVRLIRVLKLNKFLKKVEEYIGDSALLNGIVGVFKLSMVIFFLAHWAACIWYFIGQSVERESWIIAGHFNEESLSASYVASLYFSLTTMLTVGYGDIAPTNVQERIFTIIVMLIGGGVFGYTMSSIALILQSLEDEKSKVRKKIFATARYMNHQGISKEVQLEVRKYLEFILDTENRSKKSEKEMLSLLPPHLHSKVTEQMNKKFVNESKILRTNFSEKVIHKIASGVQEKMYGPGDVVYDLADQELAIYFIIKGTIGMCYSKINKPVFTLKKANYFGEISFYTGLQRTVIAQCQDFTQLFYLKRETMLEILEEFPLDKEMFHMIKDNLATYEKYQILKVKCQICQQEYHFEDICPSIHYVPDKFEVIQQHLMDQQEFADDFMRRSRTRFKPRENLTTLSTMISNITSQKRLMTPSREISLMDLKVHDSPESPVISPHKSWAHDDRNSFFFQTNTPVNNTANLSAKRITLKGFGFPDTEINLDEVGGSVTIQKNPRYDLKVVEGPDYIDWAEKYNFEFDKIWNYEIYFPHNNLTKILDSSQPFKFMKNLSDIEVLKNHLGRFFKATGQKGPPD